jgi:hypothetical protein
LFFDQAFHHRPSTVTLEIPFSQQPARLNGFYYAVRTLALKSFGIETLASMQGAAMSAHTTSIFFNQFNARCGAVQLPQSVF